MRIASRILILVACLLLPATARADAVRVFSVQGIDCADCGTPITAAVKKIKGVKKVNFDKYKAELTVTAADGVPDQVIVETIARTERGFSATAGAGKGAYLPVEKYPPGADVVVLTQSGAAVGPLDKLRVPGKFTVFDVYADWCGPCRAVDAQLRETVGQRSDVAVRKLNVVRFDSPLAKELGARLTALPHVVVFSPSGKRTDLTGADPAKLRAALGAP